MKAFHRIFAIVIAVLVILLVLANVVLLTDNKDSGRPYRVEINRLVREMEANSFDTTDLAHCNYVTNVEKYGEEFYNSDSDYLIREING